MHPISIGIVGYGGFGRFLHAAWERRETVSVQAVADADPARHTSQVRCYTRWEDLVADPDVTLVAVATPPATHAAIACAAMAAGKHVLIEKPLATTRDDAERILRVRDQTRRVAAVDYMLRFNPVVEALHAWSRSGCFGRLRRVVVENYAQDESLPATHWFWDPAQSGGILVEHAVHFIDIVNGCTPARPVRVDGLGLRRNAGQEDRMMATVVYEDGLVASHYHAFSRPGFFEQTTQRYVFDLVQIEVEGWIPLTGRVSALVSEETRPELERLPGFVAARSTGIDTLPDVSRPEGWGLVAHSAAQPGARTLHSGGVAYTVDRLVEGAFAVPLSKSEAYAAALRALLSNVVAAIHDPTVPLRAPLEAGLESLAIALEATARAHV